MPSDITINSINVTLYSFSSEDIARALWDGDVVENIGRYETTDYIDRMVTATAETLLWADTKWADDTEGRVPARPPAYEDVFTPHNQDVIRTDVLNFLTTAWPYLANDGISPEDAGHNFQLSRNGHGTGFWDRGYKWGTHLHDIAKTFGERTASYDLDENGEFSTVTLD